jgi:hypothetical protein
VDIDGFNAEAAGKIRGDFIRPVENALADLMIPKVSSRFPFQEGSPPRTRGGIGEQDFNAPIGAD